MSERYKTKEEWALANNFTLNSRLEPVPIVDARSLAQVIGLKTVPEGDLPKIKKIAPVETEFIPNTGSLKTKVRVPSTDVKFEVETNSRGTQVHLDKKVPLDYDKKSNAAKASIKLDQKVNNTTFRAKLAAVNGEVNPKLAYTVKQKIAVGAVGVIPEATWNEKGALTSAAIEAGWLNGDRSSTDVKVGLANLDQSKLKQVLTVDVNQATKSGVQTGIQVVVGGKGEVSVAAGFGMKF